MGTSLPSPTWPDAWLASGFPKSCQTASELRRSYWPPRASAPSPQPAPAVVGQQNPWAVFQAYLDAVATRASERVVPRWVERLGAADVFTNENAWAMAEAVRIDYGDLGPFGIRP